MTGKYYDNVIYRNACVLTYYQETGIWENTKVCSRRWSGKKCHCKTVESIPRNRDSTRHHTAPLMENYFEAETIQLKESPTGSPDLNPNEHVWETLRRLVSTRRRHQEWNSIP
ncbi:hypothetical protein TNCV_5127691 [Trichonephila clavipes]|nr:hypothetical protein TNCV_5127691 [Trichonephila clavipes]